MPTHTPESWRKAGFVGKSILPTFEAEVLSMVENGKSHKEIADYFGVDRSAVSYFLKNVETRKAGGKPKKKKPIVRPEKVANTGIAGNERAIMHDYRKGMSKVSLSIKYGVTYKQMKYFLKKRLNRSDDAVYNTGE